MEWILTWLWQGMAVALVTAAALRFTTTLSAANRYVVLWTATIAVLLLTLVALFPEPQPASHGDVVQSLPIPPHPVPLELPAGALLVGDRPVWPVDSVRGIP